MFLTFLILHENLRARGNPSGNFIFHENVKTPKLDSEGGSTSEEDVQIAELEEDELIANMNVMEQEEDEGEPWWITDSLSILAVKL